MNDREELAARAEELGVEFDANTTNDDLRQRITEAEGQAEDDESEPANT